MSRFIQSFLLVFLLLCYASAGAQTASRTPDGYPVANFGITANVSADGSFVGAVLRNPGALGSWLEDMGVVDVLIEKNGSTYRMSDFAMRSMERSFPFAKGEYSGAPLATAKVGATLFCPLALNDMATSALPVIMIELDFTGGDESEDFGIVFRPSKVAEDTQNFDTDLFTGFGNDKVLIAADRSGASAGGSGLKVNMSLRPGEKKSLRALLVYYDPDWVSAKDFASPQEIAAFVYSVWDDLKARTESFAGMIPQTGDRELDTYLRWYMIPGISLTKCTRNGEVLNMGYCELNQRDSYWTSWLHLVMFRDIDRKMIEESIAAVGESGKVPTTILPLIEREDDLDINAFLLLRIARYYRLYHNKDDLRQWWPVMKRVMDWLISRDTSGKGLPMQVSFWGDWKDVGGIEGRVYSPFSGLIYLAALKNMEAMAVECDDSRAEAVYAEAYAKGYSFINSPVEEGGMWNGNYYCQIWNDGSVNTRLLQDQTIGVLLGVVPDDRCESIINSLNKTNLTPYGICETYPYYPDSFGYEQGTYHNGGIWPWVSFMDDWARLRMGRRNEALNLVKTVAEADLVASGDWAPNEHLNSRTGENLGFKLQGWNSALFGLVYFGLLHPDFTPWY